MPVTPLASPVSPKNRASISPSFMPTPGSTEDHPPKPTCSATSKSRRHQSIRWSSPSNDMASCDDSPDSQGPSRSSLLPKTCPSCDDANSNRQNLCVTPLSRPSAIRLTPRAHRSLPRAPRPLPHDRQSGPRAGPSRGLRGQAPRPAKPAHIYAGPWPVFTPPLTPSPYTAGKAIISGMNQTASNAQIERIQPP